MIEDGDSQMSYCADLVTLKTSEAFPLTLLNNHPSGEWLQVEKVCQESGIATTGMKAELVTAWLPDPFGDQTYAVIIFYDDETKESFAAHYNKDRLSAL
jgi:hypothetical protein